MGKPSKPRRLIPVQVTQAEAASLDWFETFLIVQRARGGKPEATRK